MRWTTQAIVTGEGPSYSPSFGDALQHAEQFPVAECLARGGEPGAARRAVHEVIRGMRLQQAGRLDLEGMITKRGRLEDINTAFEDMKAGRVIRTVIELSYSGSHTRTG